MATDGVERDGGVAVECCEGLDEDGEEREGVGGEEEVPV